MGCKNCENLKNGSIISIDANGKCIVCGKNFGKHDSAASNKMNKRGIILTADSNLYDTLERNFPEWTVVASRDSRIKNVIEVYPVVDN